MDQANDKMVLVDGIPFPQKTMTTTKPLSLLAHGMTDMEIHFLQIKFTAIGIYLDSETILTHLNNYKGKTGDDLLQDDSFFDTLISAPVEKSVRVVVIKEIKGSQYGLQLESWVRDGLAAIDKYEDEEEEELEKLIAFFQSKYFKQHSVITFTFPAATPVSAEIVVTTTDDGQIKEGRIKVENANVTEMIQKWYMGGSRAVSPSTIQSLATNVAALLN
eukprot:TRINITY_DN17766_c0_g1_i1.p1 TRINITY_DN17766_c0_g1~~TRINITY_DN17766_c0_g1_i1.p1  ORF type:complete len:218 (-),score=20.81 TRINITY_DN17766_c0_g1_i1:71-724(-)